MKKYSPFSQPKAEEWLALDEQSRIDTTGHNMEDEYFHDLNELTEESWHRGLQ